MFAKRVCGKWISAFGNEDTHSYYIASKKHQSGVYRGVVTGLERMCGTTCVFAVTVRNCPTVAIGSVISCERNTHKRQCTLEPQALPALSTATPKPRVEGSNPSAPAKQKALKPLVSRLFCCYHWENRCSAVFYGNDRDRVEDAAGLLLRAVFHRMQHPNYIGKSCFPVKNRFFCSHKKKIFCSAFLCL